MILKVASLLPIHTCSLGASILLEEAKAAGVEPTPKEPAGDGCLRQDESRGPVRTYRPRKAVPLSSALQTLRRTGMDSNQVLRGRIGNVIAQIPELLPGRRYRGARGRAALRALAAYVSADLTVLVVVCVPSTLLGTEPAGLRTAIEH
jgi:hypothetical protein